MSTVTATATSNATTRTRNPGVIGTSSIAFRAALGSVIELSVAASTATEGLKVMAEGFRLSAVNDLNDQFGGAEAVAALSTQADALSARLNSKYI